MSFSVSLVSWNLHGLPYPFDLHLNPFDKAPRHRKRIENVTELVLKLSPDLVALQEVWIPGDIVSIMNSFRAAGYEVLEPPGKRFPRPGGLIIGVNTRRDWTVEDPGSFIEYTASADVDARSHKGFRAVRIRRKASERLILINTHLQSQYPPKSYAEVRKSQITQMSREAARLAMANPEVPLLACGDFNTYPYPADQGVYTGFSESPWLDLTRETRVACGCETNFNSNGKGMDGWIDYVLAHGNPRFDFRAEIDLLANRSIDEPFSDHQGLLARINIGERIATRLIGVGAFASVPRISSRRDWLSSLCAAVIDANWK